MTYTLSDHATTTAKERRIKAEWIKATITAPDLTITDPNEPTKTHAFKIITDNENRVLRVIYNHTKEPPHVVTVFFDRGMKGKL